ncbi:MAG: autotransporter domain-containing protein [Methyloligellaceae bacterium]
MTRARAFWLRAGFRACQVACVLAFLAVAASGPALAQCVVNGAPPPDFNIQNSAATINLDVDCPGAAGPQSVSVPAGIAVNTAGGDGITDNAAAAVWALTNNGTIVGNNNGVALNDTGSSILNTSTIQGVNAAAVFLSAGGTVTNLAGGQITGNTVGVFVDPGGAAASVINAGTITGTSAITFSAAAVNDVLELRPGSNITGTVTAQAGVDTLRLGGAGAQAFDVSQVGAAQQYVGFETFEKIGTSTWTLVGIDDDNLNWSVQGGTLFVNGTSPGAFTVQNGAALGGIGSTGDVTANAGGIVAPGNSIGTLIVNGDLTLNPGAILQNEVNAAGQSDLIIVNGGLTITGAILQVLEQPGAYAATTSYTIIANDGVDPVVGTFASITNTLAFLDATVTTTGGDGNDVVLTLTRNSTGFTDVAVTTNQNAVAGGLNRLEITPGSDGETVINSVLGLSAAGARAAFDAISGEVYASGAHTFLSQGGAITGTIANRLSDLQADGGVPRTTIGPLSVAGVSMTPNRFATAMLLGRPERAAKGSKGSLKDAPAPVRPKRNLDVWTRTSGGTGTYDNDGNAAEADETSYSFVVGADSQVTRRLRIGVAGGAGRSEFELDDRSSELDSDTYNIQAYGSFVAGAFHASLTAGYTNYDFEGERQIAFGTIARTARSDYDGDGYSAYGEVGVTKRVGRFAIQPALGGRYAYLDADGFTETGAGALNLINTGEDFTTVETIAVLRASTVWRGKKATWVPQWRIAWTHFFGDVTPETVNTFAGGGTFTVTGVERARDTTTLGSGMNVFFSDRLMAYVDSSATLSDEQEQYAISGGFRFKF